MKTTVAYALFLLAGLSSTALAETSSTKAETCSFSRPPADESDACKAMRAAVRKEVNDCMAAMSAEADSKVGKPVSHTAHSARARFLLCNAEARKKLGLPAQ